MQQEAPAQPLKQDSEQQGLLTRVIEVLSREKQSPEETAPGIDAAFLLLPVCLSVLLTAWGLWHEYSIPIATVNDGSFHYLAVTTAGDALRNGQSLTDHWAPVFPVGASVFLYYQHIPHISVVLLQAILLPNLSLQDVFNLVRFLLLAGFPITVYFSLRRMDFSRPAASIAAAASPLLSGNYLYGFEYESYIWRGFGMYTQLWAMHLSFITIALLSDVLNKGRSHASAIAALSLLVLSHTLYAYMMAITAGVLLLSRIHRGNAVLRFSRLAAVGMCAVLISSYYWLPFSVGQAYLNISPYLQQEKYDSWGASSILEWLFTGTILDHNRLPVLTVMMGLGLIAALLRRTSLDRTVLALFGVWLLLYFGRETWGSLINVLPLSDSMLMHRFIGSLDIALIMLIGLGGAAVWRAASGLLKGPLRAPVFGLAVFVVLLPAYHERLNFYDVNKQWMRQTEAAVRTETGVNSMLSTIKNDPAAGRTFAGLAPNWGRQERVGFLSIPDMLSFHQIETLSPPSLAPSINSDLLWHFNDQQLAHYELYNVSYLIAPASLPFPSFANPIREAGRFRLYHIESGGYFTLGTTPVTFTGDSTEFLAATRTWLQGIGPDSRIFPALQLDGMDGAVDQTKPVLPLSEAASYLSSLAPTAAPAGTISYQQQANDRHTATVRVEEDAMLILKVSYHPNWHAYVDGKKVETTMVMPSYIGVPLTAGLHDVMIEYQPSQSRTYLRYGGLVLMGLIAVAGAAGLLQRLDNRLEARITRGQTR